MTDIVHSCRWCANIHTGKCPLVKAIDYHQDGTVKRVEFYSATDYHPTSLRQMATDWSCRPTA